MTDTARGRLERRLAAAAGRASDDLRAEAAQQGWPPPSLILAHSRHRPAADRLVAAQPTPGSGR